MKTGWLRIWGAVLGILAVSGAFWASRVSLEDRVPRKLGVQPDGSVLVPTNQLLTPAGAQLLFPGRPTDLAQSPNHRLRSACSAGTP